MQYFDKFQTCKFPKNLDFIRENDIAFKVEPTEKKLSCPRHHTCGASKMASRANQKQN